MARAQQPMLPVIGLVGAAGGAGSRPNAAAFRKGLNETGYVEGQNVTVEYHWMESQYDRLPALMADLVRRRVAVIATPGGGPAAMAAKAATATIPIVFGIGQDPVKVGLVASLSRPGGNATGVSNLTVELVPFPPLDARRGSPFPRTIPNIPTWRHSGMSALPRTSIFHSAGSGRRR
jgi:putative ABC transport system substrate-binding protein